MKMNTPAAMACPLLVLLASAAFAGVDPAKDVWFHADFDSPVRLNGEAMLVEMNDAGYLDGRFGRGYHFYRETNNKLPPMDQFFAGASNLVVIGQGKLERAKTSAKFSGGMFAVAPRPTGVGYHWVGHDAGNTWSFFVKGAKGTKVTAYPRLTKLTEKERKDCAKAHPLDNEVIDSCTTNTVELTGDWQRVSCWAIMDNRTGGKRKSGLVVTSTGPIEVERFQLQVTGVYPYKGQFAPGKWVDGGRKASGTVITTADTEQLKTFPYKNGTMAFWIKNAPDVSAKDQVNLFSFTTAWASQWWLRSGAFKAGDGGSQILFKHPIPRTEGWTHVAVTWRDGRMAYYLNGTLDTELTDDEKKKIAVKCVPMKDNKGRFRFGAACDGCGPTDAVLDDFSIFNRELEGGEIAMLAATKKGLYEGSKEVLAENILYRTFFRDDPKPALRFRVVAPEAATYDLVSEVGGVKGPVFSKTLEKGVSYLEVPFEPAKFRPGVYPFEFKLMKDGVAALTRKGELTVKGRLGIEGDPFVFMSWGGMGYIRPDYLQTLGVNGYNVSVGDNLEIRKALNAGMFVNLRLENGNAWFTEDFDMKKIQADATKRLMPYAGLANWRTMLLNSEIYGSGTAKRAKDNPKYQRIVEKATGVKSEFTFGDAPSEVNFRQLGVQPVRGEIDHKACPTLETLNFVCGKGLPPVLTNYKTTEAVHALKPDVTVWSEPCFGALFESVDMGADWEYEYSAPRTLHQLRMHYAYCRAYNRPYQPTLGGNYWPEQKGRHPYCKDKNGKPLVVDMAQGVDEVTIKTWMSMGAVPMHNLSWFGLNSWQFGEENAKKFQESETNSFTCIAEPDAAARFGKRWRETLLPAATLLRDMPNEKAKIAYLSLPEIAHAAGFWWGIAHYPNTITDVMANEKALFDYIGREELLSGYADDYDYIVYPMCHVVYKEHAEALRKAAAKGVKIVMDSYATNRYENCIVLDKLKYEPGNWKKMQDTVKGWYTNIVDEVAAKAFASSPKTDGKSSYTFVKEYKGAKYVVVVNNKRDEKPSFSNLFKTNDWYRVAGAPQTIETKIRAPKGAAIYGFNGADFSEYAAAEGRIFAVYPKKLAAPELSLVGDAKPGTTVKLVVKINDADGKPAPGRQVVRLKLTDVEGVERDESGLYSVEDGRAEIVLRIPACEAPTGGWFSPKWLASVTDLTTGKTETLKVAIK